MEPNCGHALAQAGCPLCGPMPTREELTADIRAARAGIASPAAIEALGLAGPCRAATLDDFVTAARALKQAEDALVAARQTYAEAVKAMSEEAVK